MSARDPVPDSEPRRDPPDGGAAAPPRPSLLELSLAFARVSLIGFGGVLPWYRRMLVEEKRWLSAEEFNQLFAVCQFLPGPNVVNMSAVLGLRLFGVVGAIVATCALALPPIALMIVLGMLYARYGGAPGISGGLAGLAAGVAGMMIATAVRMAQPVVRSRFRPEPLVALAAFAAIGLLRLPLLSVLAVLVPISIGLAWWVRR